MYENGHPGFAFKSIILKLLLIIVLIFLIIWLFPTKGYMKNLIDQKLTTNSNQVFNSNIQTIQNASASYFTGNRLPSKVGESKTITLKEMIDQKLLVDITDGNGKKCDYNKSNAKVIKNKSDYVLKVNLTCKDKKANVTSYLGSSEDTSDVYSKKKLDDNQVSENTKNEEQTSNEKKSTTNDKSVTNKSSDSKTYQCEYLKQTSGYYSYGNWSSWSTRYVASTSTREVQTTKQKVQVGTTTGQTGTTKHTQAPKKVTVLKNGKQSVVYVCPSNFDNGGSYNYYVTCVKTMPVYGEVPTYSNVTVYRYRDKKYVSGGTSYKWSNCNDNTLLNQGYKKTGKTK